MHYSRTYCLIIFAFFYSYARGQDTINSNTVEKRSYDLYMAKNWHALEEYGRVAIEHGIDYYYLRMRLGMAYYEGHNYLKAEDNFRKALTFNSGDANAMEYIYYCMIFTGRYEEARFYSKSFNEAVKEEVKVNTLPCIDAITLESGVEISDSNKSFGNLYYAQLGLEHYIGNRLSLFHAFKYSTQVSYIVALPNAKDSTAPKKNYSQLMEYEYYLKATIPFANKWVVSPAVHWLGVESNDTSIHPPLPPPPHPPKGYRPIPGSKYDSTFFSNYWVASVSAEKRMSCFHLLFTLTLAHVDSNTSVQEQLSLDYSPFGNRNLILGIGILPHTQNGFSSNYMAVNPYLQIRPAKNLTISASYLANQGFNVIQYDGYSVDNIHDLTTSVWSATAEYQFAPVFSFYATYQLINEENTNKNFTYNYTLLAAGIKILPK